jgi:hypothetical protein
MKRVSLHNIHYSAHSDFPIREVGESGTRGGTSLVAPRDFSVKPFLRVLRRAFPLFCFSQREAVCADARSSWPVVVVCSGLRSLPRVQLHAWELRTGYRRLFLLCPTCRQESAGWSWSDLARPRLRYGAPRRRVRFGWSINTATKRLLG